MVFVKQYIQARGKNKFFMTVGQPSVHKHGGKSSVWTQDLRVRKRTNGYV